MRSTIDMLILKVSGENKHVRFPKKQNIERDTTMSNGHLKMDMQIVDKEKMPSMEGSRCKKIIVNIYILIPY